MGDIVSSQAYKEEEEEDVDHNEAENTEEDQPVDVANEEWISDYFRLQCGY